MTIGDIRVVGRSVGRSREVYIQQFAMLLRQRQGDGGRGEGAVGIDWGHFA